MKYYKHYVRFCFFALSCIIITLLMIGCGMLKRGSLKKEIDGKIALSRRHANPNGRLCLTALFFAEVINGEIIGHIDTIDGHGNAVTNIPESLFARLEWQRGDTLEVEFTKSRKIVCQYVKDYGDVPVDDYLCRFSSEGVKKY